MNNLQMQGRIPFDVKFFAASGEKKAFAQFTIAINTGIKDDSTGYYKEDLFRCKAWGYSAEHLDKYFQTRDMVTFDGKLVMGQDWTNESGEIVKGAPEIMVNKIYGFGTKGQEEKTSAPKAAAAKPTKPSSPAKPTGKPAAAKPASAPAKPKAPAIKK
jgi:single-stranded DNA-binding protein